MKISTDDRPLSGIRVLDLGWITAGAGTAALLADLGADVIKIEGPGAPDPFRFWKAEDPDVDWWNRSPFFASTNHDKRSLCLDLKAPAGQEAMLRLLQHADVLVENFRRGVLNSFGIGAAMLRDRFPKLIIASISSQGETGPDSGKVSFGSTLEATSGMAALAGAGEAPLISGRDVNYPDQVACLFTCGAIVAALIERKRTSQGAHLDLSQRELATFLLGEEVLAASAGSLPTRWGNHDPLSPGETLTNHSGRWFVTSHEGAQPVRNAGEVVASREFGIGTAMSTTASGDWVKGIPFRLTRRPLSARNACAPLGAHNAEVLTEVGYTQAEVAELRKAGTIATAPRQRKTIS